jgi:hypothetical protein
MVMDGVRDEVAIATGGTPGIRRATTKLLAEKWREKRDCYEETRR